MSTDMGKLELLDTYFLHVKERVVKIFFICMDINYSMTSLFAHTVVDCPVHQLEIFAQEFEPASYFCNWTCVHLTTSQQ